MRRDVSAAAWASAVLLVTLWLAAGGSSVTGPGRLAGTLPRPPLPPPRLRRFSRAPCPVGTRWTGWGGRCCTPCPAGTFLRSPCTNRSDDRVCEPCPAGTFHSLSNTALACRACYECDRQALQSVLSNCSATSNVVCSCEAGYYKECIDSHCSNFHCRECRTCAGSLVARPCSLVQDTQCGSCKPDFYAEGGKCHPCPPRDADACSEECQRACNRHRGVGLEYLLLGLAGPLFLGALAIYHRRLRHKTSGCSPLPASPRRGSPDPAPGPVSDPAAAPGPMPGLAMQSCCKELDSGPMVPAAPAEEVLQRSPPSAGAGACWGSRCRQPGPAITVLPEATALLQWCCPQPEHLLQGSQLYAIIDAVPLRRWKELMRVLGLRDADIEVVELEFAHVRDQQYEMLKRWGQQSSASLGRVFAALEHMELEGCAQALRLRLQDCP